MGSTVGVNYDLVLALLMALRGQIFECLRGTLYRHALEYLQSARSEKKEEEKILLKRLTIIDPFGGLWLMGKRFRH